MIRPGGLDQGEVREGLREVPEVAAGVDLELLGVQAERRGDAQQPLHQVARPLHLADATSAETSQNEQIRKVPSLPDSPSSVSSVR